jgi:hypothetical protein
MEKWKEYVRMFVILLPIRSLKTESYQTEKYLKIQSLLALIDMCSRNKFKAIKTTSNLL